MRNIKFRGWCEKDSEWRFGYYVTDGVHHEILTLLSGGELYASAVDPEDVSQFTGLTDKNGVEIYDGDIIQSYHFTDTNGKDRFINHIVEWSDKFNGWFMRNEHDKTRENGSIQSWVYMRANKNSAKVIGNIHGVKHEK